MVRPACPQRAPFVFPEDAFRATTLRMNSDAEWEKWGKRDPFYAVLTGPQFRAANWNAHAKREFFKMGETHFGGVLEGCRRLDPAFLPRRSLEFGCGVGRLLIPLSRVSNQAVGVDVSSSMLKHAAAHCQEQGIQNVSLAHSDDALSEVKGKFDLIMSFIVFQHIPVRRGKVIFSRLLELLNEGGIAAIHVPYARVGPTPIAQADWLKSLRSAIRTTMPFLFREPQMEMNVYPIADLLARGHRNGVRTLHIELSSDASHAYAFLFLRKESGS